MKRYLVLLVAMLPVCAHGAREKILGRIFEIGETGGSPLFTQEILLEDLPDGTRKSTSSIRDAGGEVIMTEEAWLRGDEILSQRIEQRQIGKEYELALDGSEVIFRTFIRRDGPRTLDSDRRVAKPAAFLTGPTTQPYLRQRWPELREGKAFKANFGVFEASRSFEFEFARKEEKEGKLVVRMKPNSFFLSLVVAPIYLTFDLSTKRLVHFKGRTPLRKKILGNWKPFDAEIFYRQQ